MHAANSIIQTKPEARFGLANKNKWGSTMKHTLMKITGMLAIAGLIVLGCDNVVDTPTDADTLQHQELSGLQSANNGTLDMLPPFNVEEMETNIDLVNTGNMSGIWTRDRSAPSGGVSSVSAFGRDDVGQLRFDDPPSVDIEAGFFERTEGLRRIDNFGSAIHIDLYIDPDWENTAVRAGFWVAGQGEDYDISDTEDPQVDRKAFAIIEFTTADSEVIDEADPDQAEVSDGDDRWRMWDGATGEWIDLDAAVNYGEWASLEIVLDDDAGVFEHYINGEPQNTTPAGASELIGEVFLNSYNYAYETTAAGTSEDFLSPYSAHWHNGDVEEELARDDCMQGGWEAFGFRNQGQCIRYVNTGQDSR